MSQKVLSRNVIQFEPHYYTLTRSGRSHFQRPEDAIAEFIDNSIQACRGVKPTRQIGVHFFSKGLMGSNNFLVFADNGCGMTTTGLKEFATFSLDQETRNNIADPNDKSFISKFGVGAKQAGFFLGDRITVLTKTSEANTLLRFSLDDGDFAERFKSGKNVYESEVVEIPLDCEQYLEPNEVENYDKLHEFVTNHILTESQFTICILRLRYDIVRVMYASRMALHNKLGEIYHFHLHPEHNFEKIPDLFRNRRQNGSSSSSKGKKQQAGNFQISPGVEESPLEIIYAHYNTESQQFYINLADAKDFVQQCFDDAEDAFPFSLEVPDPNGELNIRNSSQLTQLQSSPKLKIKGFLLYFPVYLGASTRPKFQLLETTSTSTATASATQESSKNNLSITDSNNSSDDNVDQIIRIYWQDRLVPETIISQLSFFPKTTKIDLEKLGIGTNWKQRLPDLNTWLNSKSIISETIIEPKTADKKFKEWLINCYNTFDREFTFKDRILPRTDIDQYETTKSYFGAMINESNSLEFKENNLIKWKVDAKQADSFIIGKIKDFVVNQQLPALETYYCGNGDIRYVRVPEEIFGSSIQTVSIRSINTQDYKVTKADLEQAKRGKIANLKFCLFGKESNQSEILDSDAELVVGIEYFKIGIQIYNDQNEVSFFLPNASSSGTAARTAGTSANTFYQIILEGKFEREDGEEIDSESGEESEENSGKGKKKKKKESTLDFGRNTTLYQFDSQSQKDVEVKAKSLKPSSNDLTSLFYSFFKIKFKKCGRVSLNAKVMIGSTDQLIYEQKIALNIVPPEIQGLRFADTTFLTTPLRLGSPFPEFRIQILDGNSQAITMFSGAIKVEITSDDMKIVPNDKSLQFITNLTPQSHGIIESQRSAWVAVPMEGKSLHNNPKLHNFPVKFRAQLYKVLNSEVQKKRVFERIEHQPFEFSLLFSPGVPKHLVLLNESEPISLKLEECPPFMTLNFGCIDNWSNRTAALDNESPWNLRFGDGPLKCGHPIAMAGDSWLCKLSVSLEDCEMSSNNELISQNVELVTKDANIIRNFQPYELQLKVESTLQPCSIRVTHDGAAIATECQVYAGEPITGLAFEILDSKEQPIDSTLLQSMRNQQSWFICSWAEVNKRKKRQRNQIPDHFELPPIQIPQKVENGPIECFLEVFIQRATLLFNFTLEVIPAAPKAWKLLTGNKFKNGLRIGEKLSAEDQIRGICLVDEYANVIPISSLVDEETQLPNIIPPLVVIEIDNFVISSQELPDENVDNKATVKPNIAYQQVIPIQEGDILFADDENNTDGDNTPLHVKRGYLIPGNLTLDQFFVLGQKLRVRVIDQNNEQYVSCSNRTQVISGAPSKIALTIPSFSITELSSTQSLEVATFSKIKDLCVHLLDQGGNPANIENISNLKLEIVGPNNKKLVNKSDWTEATCTFALNYDFSSTASAAAAKKRKRSTGDEGEEIGDAEENRVSNTEEKEFICNISFSLNREVITLPSAALKCKVIKFNNILDFKISLLVKKKNNVLESLSQQSQIFSGSQSKVDIPTTELKKRDDTYQFEVFAGEPLPSFLLQAITDDGKVYIPDITTSDGNTPLNMKLLFKRGKQKDTIQVDEIYTLSVDKKFQAIIFHPKVDLAKNNQIIQAKTGVYEMKIVYNETRSSLQTMPISMKQIKLSVSITIFPGKSRKLQLEKSCFEKLNRITVTNTSNVKQRLLGKDIVIQLVDEYENICHFDAQDDKLYCEIISSKEREKIIAQTARNSRANESLSSPSHEGGFSGIVKSPFRDSTPSKEIPILEGKKQIDGMMTKNYTECIFDALHIKHLPNSVIPEGEYYLLFALQTNSSTLSASSPNVLSTPATNAYTNVLLIPFHYTSNHLQQEELQKLRETLNPLYEMRNKLLECDDELKQIQEELEKKYRSRNSSIQISHARDDLTQLENLRIRRNQQLTDMQHHMTQFRVCKKIPNHPPSEKLLGIEGLEGLVVELGCVNHETEAKILSWVAGSMIDAMVVKTTSQGNILYEEKKIKVIPLDQIIPFKVHERHGVKRIRNEQETARQELPFGPILMRNERNEEVVPSGNPRYLVNMIKLPRDREQLRDTLFFNIYQKSILFDDMKNALVYRQSLIRQEIQPPMLYTLRGERITGNALLDPSANAKLPSTLEFVYGEEPHGSTSRSEYNQSEREIELLDDIIVLQRRKQEVTEKKRSLLASMSISEDRLLTEIRRYEQLLHDQRDLFSQL